jgi:hypothetical protein
MDAESRCKTHLKRISELAPLLQDALERSTSREAPNTPPGLEQTEAFKQEKLERNSNTKLPNVNYLPDSEVPPDLEVSAALQEMRVTLAESHDRALEIVGLPRSCSRCGHSVVFHFHQRHHCMCDRCENYRLSVVLSTSPSWGNLMASSPRVATAIEAGLARVVSVMEYALDLADTGKLIQVPCPWCHGITQAMPEGSLTMRVYVPGAAPDTYVMCRNKRCDPPAHDCGSRVHGFPCWPFPELDWLAKRLDMEVERIRAEREHLMRPTLARTG